MARDYPLDDEQMETFAAGRDHLLDRRMTLTLPASRWIVASVALVTAALLRLIGLNRWALSAAESETALAAWNLVRGDDLPSDLLGRPLLIEWSALFMFLGHATDSVARIAMAVAGISLIVSVILLGRWIGATMAGATALLIALSPTMIAGSRRLDGGMLVALLVASFVLLAFASRDRPSSAWPVALGAIAALLVLSGPIGIAGLIVAVIGALLLTGTRSATPASLLPAVGGFAVTYAILSTVFFTRPSALLSATGEIFGQFFADHLANAGERFHVPAANLIINEPILFALAVTALIASPQREMARALGVWAAITLLLVSFMGDTGIAGHVLVVLPLALLAGLGLAYLVQRLPWGLLRRGPAALFIGATILLFLAVLSLIGLVTPDGGLTGWDWVARLVLIVLIVVLPLAVYISMISPRLTGHHTILVVSAALLLLSLLTIRSAVLAASDRPGEPTDPLAQGMIGESLPLVVDRIERLSVDLTRTERTIQDPTGGHGLHVAVDQDIQYPLAWYFREFPNLTVFDPDETSPPEATQVAFIAGHRDPSTVTPGMEGETYPYRHVSPSIFRDPDWGDLLGGLFSISEWRHFWGYLIDRTAPDPADQRSFQLMLAPAIAERLFGPTGPFALDEMAGAGTEGGQFSSPRGIAFGEDGSIYVVDSGNQRVQVFNPDGEFVMAFGEPGSEPGQFGQFSGGQGGAGDIAVTGDRIYVADTWNHRVQVFDLDGGFLFEWGEHFDALDDPEASASNPGGFYGPRGIDVYDDLVFVTDTGNERVQVFNLDGEFQTMWGTPGNAEGQLLEPVGIAVHDDVVHVADSHNARISRFSVEGDLVDTWHTEVWDGLRFYEPYLAIAGDGRVFATTSVTGEVLVFDPASGEAQPWPSSEILRPYGIAIAPDDSTTLVTDGIRNAVLPLETPTS